MALWAQFEKPLAWSHAGKFAWQMLISYCCYGKTRAHFLTCLFFCNCPTVVSLSLKWKGMRLFLKWRPTQATHSCTFLATLPTTWRDLKSSTRELMTLSINTIFIERSLLVRPGVNTTCNHKEVFILSPLYMFYSQCNHMLSPVHYTLAYFRLPCRKFP